MVSTTHPNWELASTGDTGRSTVQHFAAPVPSVPHVGLLALTLVRSFLQRASALSNAQLDGRKGDRGRLGVVFSIILLCSNTSSSDRMAMRTA